MAMSEAERRQMARKHVFIINSAPEFLNFVRELLQDEDYNVTTTNFVPHTYDQIAALQPDLLMVDLVAGEQAGWDLLERLQHEAETTGIPVLITSTNPALLERVRSEPARFSGQHLVAKPFDIEVLLRAVHELIGGTQRPNDADAARG
jgi:DNA-binding response OmpR family regulator